MSVVSCGSPASPAFWISQLLASGVPWLVVHAVLFPLTINQGLVVHGVRPGARIFLWAGVLAAWGRWETCPEAGGVAKAAAQPSSLVGQRCTRLAILACSWPPCCF